MITEPMTPADFARLEKKVDQLTTAVTNLVLIEERQTNQSRSLKAMEDRINALEKEQLATDRKVDRWINRFIGVWAVVATIFSAIKLFH